MEKSHNNNKTTLITTITQQHNRNMEKHAISSTLATKLHSNKHMNMEKLAITKTKQQHLLKQLSSNKTQTWKNRL
jgi:hypothetical protein